MWQGASSVCSSKPYLVYFAVEHFHESQLLVSILVSQSLPQLFQHICHATVTRQPNGMGVHKISLLIVEVDLQNASNSNQVGFAALKQLHTWPAQALTGLKYMTTAC